jgi:hypothetical protein
MDVSHGAVASRLGSAARVAAGRLGRRRAQQNEHFMSDVLVGAAIGIASARVVTIGHRPRCVNVTLVPVSGGAALMFTVVPR